jgi:hypothetical protein
MPILDNVVRGRERLLFRSSSSAFLKQLGYHALCTMTSGTPVFLLADSPQTAFFSGGMGLLLSAFNFERKKVVAVSVFVGLAVASGSLHLENRQLKGLPPYPIVNQTKNVANNVAEKTRSLIKEIVPEK